MLTPMMIQYLVGLCCLRHDPEAVEITLGDMVYDHVAEKDRDVDITITFKDGNEVTAFKAVEVKKESQPLDVATIEQLCLKFIDMPQITHRSIFSTSGYTEAAKKKAKHYSVELYTLKPWQQRIEDDFPDFKGVGSPSEFLSRVDACILRWIQYNVHVTVPGGPESFRWYDDTPLFSSAGKSHNKYTNMKQYVDYIVRHSAEILCTIGPILKGAEHLVFSQDSAIEYAKGPAINHAHTMDVNADAVYLKFPDGLHQICSLTILGQLQWSMRKRNPDFFILENVNTQEIFAGAAITDYGENDGRMFAMIFPEKGREVGIHPFSIPEKQKNIIRKIKIKS